MLDGLSMDQLRTFIAAAEEGSFSAAARKLRRAQSVVSQTVSNLEHQVGIALFTRGGRMPRLTDAGKVLLDEARAAVACMDSLKAKAKALSGGLEPELSIVMDVMFPLESLTQVLVQFHTAFPRIPVRLYNEALGAVVKPVLDRTCRIGVIGTLAEVPEVCQSEFLLHVPAIAVVAPGHPLAQISTPIAHHVLDEHVQLILTDRTSLTEGRSFGVLSEKVWRLGDLGIKHALLRAGLGWGYMPEAMVRNDLSTGALVKIVPADHPWVGPAFSMRAIYRNDNPPGPAGRWFINALKQVERGAG